MKRLVLEIMRVESNGFMHIRNAGKAFAIRPGKTLADEIVEQALAIEPRVHDGKSLYVPGEYPESIMLIELSFMDDDWRCWYYGNMAGMSKVDDVLRWRPMCELEAFLREIVADLEHAIITWILSKEAA